MQMDDNFDFDFEDADFDDFVAFKIKGAISTKSDLTKDLVKTWLEVDGTTINRKHVDYDVDGMATFMYYYGRFMALSARKLTKSQYGKDPTFPIQMALIRALICDFFLILEQCDADDFGEVPPTFFVSMFVNSMLDQLHECEVAFRTTSKHKDSFSDYDYQ